MQASSISQLVECFGGVPAITEATSNAVGFIQLKNGVNNIKAVSALSEDLSTTNNAWNRMSRQVENRAGFFTNICSTGAYLSWNFIKLIGLVFAAAIEWGISEESTYRGNFLTLSKKTCVELVVNSCTWAVSCVGVASPEVAARIFVKTIKELALNGIYSEISAIGILTTLQTQQISSEFITMLGDILASLRE